MSSIFTICWRVNAVFKTVSSSHGSNGGGMLWEDLLRKHSGRERVLTHTQASWLQMVQGGLQQLLAPAKTSHSEVEPLSPSQGLFDGSRQVLQHIVGHPYFVVQRFRHCCCCFHRSSHLMQSWLKMGGASKLLGNLAHTWEVVNFELEQKLGRDWWFSQDH